MELGCGSKIVQVTVHARGAVVTRAVALPEALPGGRVDVRVDGVTPLAIAGSVRAQVRAPRRDVVSVHSALAVPAVEAQAGPSVERVRALEVRCARTRAELARVGARAARLRDLTLSPRLGVLAREPVDVRIGDALATADVLRALVAQDDERLSTLSRALRDLERERDAAALADAQARSSERMGTGHPTRQVTVRLAGDGPVEGLQILYAVPPARWWPLYTLRMSDAGRRATWLFEALVCQLSGEDWSGARLSLSTADLLLDARLPELPSLRLGRAPVPPARRGFRPAPEGLDRLFAGYDRVGEGFIESIAAAIEDEARQVPAVAPQPARPPGIPPCEAPLPPLGAAAPRPALARQAQAMPSVAASFDALPLAPPAPGGLEREERELDRSSRKRARAAAPAAPPPPSFAPRAGGPGLPKCEEASAWDETTGETLLAGADDGPDASDGAAGLEPGDAWLDFDALSLAARGARRGRLAPAADGPEAAGRREAVARLEALAPPAPVLDPLETRGQYDHRYDAAGLAEVPSDGGVHRVTVGVTEATPELRYRTVPREAAEVYREARLANPFDAPLLAGPVDVYVEGSLLASTEIAHVGSGGQVAIGMGVEDRLRVARNARVEEQSAGLLGGSTAVVHAVEIQLTSSLAHEAQVEVLDRIPVTDAKDVEIEASATPKAEAYDQAERGAPVRGGRRWRVTLPPAGRTTLELRYQIKLPSKCELVGGNRRE